VAEAEWAGGQAEEVLPQLEKKGDEIGSVIGSEPEGVQFDYVVPDFRDQQCGEQDITF